MNIALKSEQVAFIQAQVEMGQYPDPEAVVQAALQLLEERDRQLSELRQKIAVGTQQIQAGDVREGEAVFAELQVKLNSMIQSDDSV
jgi:antitoxin ParD1/3/4